jgi:hypothetical protein
LAWIESTGQPNGVSGGSRRGRPVRSTTGCDQR